MANVVWVCGCAVVWGCGGRPSSPVTDFLTSVLFFKAANVRQYRLAMSTLRFQSPTVASHTLAYIFNRQN